MGPLDPFAPPTPTYVGSKVSEVPPALVAPDLAAHRIEVGACAACGAEIWVRIAALADFAEQGGGELVYKCSTCAAAQDGWERRRMPRWMRRSKAHHN